MLTHLLAVLVLAALCAGWALLKLWSGGDGLKREDRSCGGGCGGCSLPTSGSPNIVDREE